jgi:hypothetical protein
MGFFVLGCAGGAPERGVRPWDYGTHETGDVAAFASGNVAHFGAAPKQSPPVAGSADNRQNSSVDFVVDTVTRSSDHQMIAHNRSPVPVSVMINVTDSYGNLAIDCSVPFHAVVPPMTDITLVRYSPHDKGRESHFRSNYTWTVGDYTARHRPPRGYALPFPKGIGATVGASPDPSTGLKELRHGMSFAIPEGTPVLAARPGVVVRAEDSFMERRDESVQLLNKTNAVDVLHDDGTIASYHHLKAHSLAVRVGQTVSAGERLGLSGVFGPLGVPLLRMVVWRPEGTETGFGRVSVPIEFCDDATALCAALKDGAVVGKGAPRKPGPGDPGFMDFVRVTGGYLQKGRTTADMKGNAPTIHVNDLPLPGMRLPSGSGNRSWATTPRTSRHAATTARWRGSAGTMRSCSSRN